MSVTNLREMILCSSPVMSNKGDNLGFIVVAFISSLFAVAC